MAEQTFKDLMYFTMIQQIKLKKCNNERVWKIASAIDQHIHKANKAKKGALKRVLALNKSNNGVEGIEDGTTASISKNTEMEYNNIHRQEDFLENLIQSRERLVQFLEKYGYCIDCGEPIPIERLEHVPHTTHCVSCKEEQRLVRRI